MDIKFDKKHKILFFCLIAFLFLDAIILSYRFASNMYSKAGLSFDSSLVSGQKMRALNANASSSKISKAGFAYYKFTPDEEKLFQEYYEHFKSVGVSVRIAVKNIKGKKYQETVENEKIFYFGYLTKKDFNEKGKFIPSEKRILSGCDLRSFIRNDKGFSLFDNLFSMEKNLKEEQLPCGFVIYSDYPIKIVDFLVEKSRVGFDYTKNVPFFGLAPNGGSFAGRSNIIDFSGCADLFPVENTRYSIMPKIELALKESEGSSDSENQLSVKFSCGGDKITVRKANGVSEYVIQASTLLSPYSSYEVTENFNYLTKLIMSANDEKLLPAEQNKVLFPLKTDPGLILSSKVASWRSKDYEIYEWDRFPGSLIFDTLNYSVQDEFFRRLAYYVEKVGFRGRLLTNEELGDMHGYNAHDYSAESLASFFTKAEKVNFQLSEKEYLLKDILIKNQIIIPDSVSYRPGKGAIVSISRESPSYLRQSLSAHELWHDIFFTNEDFRNAVAAVYYTVDNNTMAFMKGYWASQPGLGYDQNDEYLMHNEFMAYLMQQPLSGTAKYFLHLAGRGSVMNYQQDLCDWVKRTEGRTFEDACRVLNTYAFDNWGLEAGRVSLITR